MSYIQVHIYTRDTITSRLMGGQFDFWGGGGGVEEIVPEQSIYFSLVRKQSFYFTMSEKQIFFSFLRKMKKNF